MDSDDSALELPDEASLVTQAMAGDTLALDRLLLRHHRTLSARIQGKIPPTMQAVVSAEDILQETFTEAYRGLPSFRADGPDAFLRWLSTIAEHRVLDAVRAHRAAKRGGGQAAAELAGGTSSAVLGLLEMVAQHERTPSQSAAGHEAVSAVRQAIDSLKPEYREAIRLRYIEGLPVADAAARMKKTERAVHKLCSRGLQRLRESLGEASKFLSRQ